MNVPISFRSFFHIQPYENLTHKAISASLYTVNLRRNQQGLVPLGDPGILVHFQTMACLLTVQGKYSRIDFVESYNLVLAADGHSDPERPMGVFPLHP